MSTRAKLSALLGKLKDRPISDSKQQSGTRLLALFTFAFALLMVVDTLPMISAVYAMRDPEITAALRDGNKRLTKDFSLSCSAHQKYESLEGTVENRALRECILARLGEMQTTAGVSMYVYRAAPWLATGVNDPEMKTAVTNAIEIGWADLRRNAPVYRATENVYAAADRSLVSRMINGSGDGRRMMDVWSKVLEDVETHAFAPDLAKRQKLRRAQLEALAE